MRFNRVIDAAIGGAISALLISPFTGLEARSPGGARHGDAGVAGHGAAAAATAVTPAPGR